MLCELASGPSRVGDLAARRPISRPAVSKHLRLLSEAGLVEASDHGRERHYSLRPEALTPVQDLVAALTGADAESRATELAGLAGALDALDTEVRRTERDRRASAAQRPTTSRPHEETA